MHHYVYLSHPKIVYCHLPKEIISSAIRRETNYLFYKGVETLRPLKLSWIEAHKACKSVGGNLPILRNRDEQDELISLVRISDYRPPQMVILFIGLVGHKVGVVLTSLYT